MKLIHVAAAIALVGLTGAAHGAPSDVRQNESAFTVDHLEALGHVYFVKCENGYDILDCKQPAIWEQANELGGLQTIKRPFNSKWVDPDVLVIG